MQYEELPPVKTACLMNLLTVTGRMDTLIEDCIGCLEQGVELLEHMDGASYRLRCANCFSSAIGGHIRHNADHFEQFLRGWASGSVDYDARSRDLEIEREPAKAIALMRTLADRLRLIPESELDAPLQVKMDGGHDAQWAASSLRRELQFLISHTIHHYALIVFMARSSGFEAIPEGFGVAPSTLKHRAAAGAH